VERLTVDFEHRHERFAGGKLRATRAAQHPGHLLGKLLEVHARTGSGGQHAEGKFTACEYRASDFAEPFDVLSQFVQPRDLFLATWLNSARQLMLPQFAREIPPTKLRDGIQYQRLIHSDSLSFVDLYMASSFSSEGCSRGAALVRLFCRPARAIPLGSATCLVFPASLATARPVS